MYTDQFVFFLKFFLFSELRDVKVLIFTLIAKIPNFQLYHSSAFKDQSSQNFPHLQNTQDLFTMKV